MTLVFRDLQRLGAAGDRWGAAAVRGPGRPSRGRWRGALQGVMNHRLRRDGIVRYPQYTHGGFASFILAWAYFLSAVTVAPSEAIAVVTYMSTWLPQLTVSGVLTPLGVVVATREVRQKLSKLREGRRKWDILRKTAKAIEELAKREQCSCGCWEDYWEC